jgi:AraC-like DNA-binding protein
MLPSTQRRIADAQELIEVCCHLPLDLETVAQRVGFSRWYFLRAFRQEYGITPHQYLIQRRIEKAKALLNGEQSEQSNFEEASESKLP